MVLSANAAFPEAMLSATLTGGQRLVHVRYDDESEAATALVEGAESAFEAAGIDLHSNYDEFFVILSGDSIRAAAALAVTEDETLSYEFSVVTMPTFRRQGLTRLLVEEVIRYARSMGAELDMETWVEAYVVNPEAMLPLLKSFGFALDGKYWRLKVQS